MAPVTFNQSINRTLDMLLQKNSDLLLLGLGITDPKAFFGTTQGLVEKYGTTRIIECPTSENAYLGHALGLALSGHKTVVHYQRMDFMLYAYDQLINNIAKWNDMFGSEHKIPLVVRCIIGMGWGQGAQHSQNLASHFLQIPGLNVVAPTCPLSAAVLLEQSLNSAKPTIFIEHRWLQFLKQDLQKKSPSIQLNKAHVRRKGQKLSILCWSYSVAEALRFLDLFPELDVEVIDLLTLSKIDYETIILSVTKTKKVLFWEPSLMQAGLSGEIISHLYEQGLDFTFSRIAFPFANPASAPQQNLNYYWSLEKIVSVFNKMLNLNLTPPTGSKWPTDVDLHDWSPW